MTAASWPGKKTKRPMSRSLLTLKPAVPGYPPSAPILKARQTVTIAICWPDRRVDYATGVAIGLYNPDKSLIAMGDESLPFALSNDQTTLALHFYARYLAVTNAVTPGWLTLPPPLC